MLMYIMYNFKGLIMDAQIFFYVDGFTLTKSIIIMGLTLVANCNAGNLSKRGKVRMYVHVYKSSLPFHCRRYLTVVH